MTGNVITFLKVIYKHILKFKINKEPNLLLVSIKELIALLEIS